jgi:phosphoserine phosphatase
MALTEKRVAFLMLITPCLRDLRSSFLGAGCIKGVFSQKKDISAFVLANLRYRLTGKENKDEITRFQNAATEFIKGHNVVEIEKIGQEIYEEYVSPAIWQGTVEIAQEHLSKGEEVWLVTATPHWMV